MSQLIFQDVTDHQPSYRAQAVETLANYRREWQKLTEGQSLIEVHVPVGLVLADIADWLELNPHERHVLLGGKLLHQVSNLMEEQVQVRLPS